MSDTAVYRHFNPEITPPPPPLSSPSFPCQETPLHVRCLGLLGFHCPHRSNPIAITMVTARRTTCLYIVNVKYLQVLFCITFICLFFCFVFFFYLFFFFVFFSSLSNPVCIFFSGSCFRWSDLHSGLLCRCVIYLNVLCLWTL